MRIDARGMLLDKTPALPGQLNQKTGLQEPMLFPKSRKATIEMLVLGCRGLKPYNFIDPVCPWVEVMLNQGDSQVGIKKTRNQNDPSGTDPNYQEIIKISTSIPEDPMYAPALSVRVFDSRFRGLASPLLGSLNIPISDYLPWIEENRTRIQKRLELSRQHGTQGQAPPEPAGGTFAPYENTRKVQDDPDPDMAGSSMLDEIEPMMDEVPAPGTPRSKHVDYDQDEPLPAHPFGNAEWMKGRRFVDDELEDWMEAQHTDNVVRTPFDESPITRGSQVASTFLSSLAEGQAGSYGRLKYLIRVVDYTGDLPEDQRTPEYRRRLGSSNRARVRVRVRVRVVCIIYVCITVRLYYYIVRMLLWRRDSCAFVSTYPGKRMAKGESLEWPISLKHILRPQALVIRVYVVAGIGLKSMDRGGYSDPYLKVRLGREVKRNDENGDDVFTNTLNPDFRQMFQFESTLPGPSKLEVMCYDFDTLATSDDLIGQTTIDLEDRFFNSEWKAMGHTHESRPGKRDPVEVIKKPMECRTLHLDGQKTSRGKLQLWVDIMTKDEAAVNLVMDICKPPPEKFELRVVIYSARDCPDMDVLTQCNDMYFSVHVSTKNKDNRIVEQVRHAPS